MLPSLQSFYNFEMFPNLEIKRLISPLEFINVAIVIDWLFFNDLNFGSYLFMILHFSDIFIKIADFKSR